MGGSVVCKAVCGPELEELPSIGPEAENSGCNRALSWTKLLASELSIKVSLSCARQSQPNVFTEPSLRS